jgi:hypothetical protein
MKRRSATKKEFKSWESRYEEQAQVQRTLVDGLASVQKMLNQMDYAFRLLISDEHFTTLLRAEGFDHIPTVILTRTRG